jgi:CheY-like chemotaxis protein
MDSSFASSDPTIVTSEPSVPLVLAIEDSDEDYEALKRSFAQSPIPTRLHRCRTGKEALEYLESLRQTNTIDPHRIPALIMLDLNLPGIDGRRVLEKIELDPAWRYIPTIVLTTSNYAKDIEECYRLGANSYLVKAFDLQKFKKTIHVTIEFWLDIATLPQVSDVLRSEMGQEFGSEG